VRAVVDAVEDEDAAVPYIGGRAEPLAAAYRVGVREVVADLLADDRLAMTALLDRCRVRRLAAEELPMPSSVLNLNEPRDYERALALRAPGVWVDGLVLPAWTLGDVLSGRTAVALNGEPVDPDPHLPLVAGDVVTFPP
jgi:hypothetical protein